MTSQDLYPIGAAGIGTWEPDGGDDFKGKFWTGFPGPDNGPGGFIKISVHGSVDGDRIKGRYHGWVYVAATMALEGEFKGRFKGKRVEV